jgi:hypothetical protein
MSTAFQSDPNASVQAAMAVPPTPHFLPGPGKSPPAAAAAPYSGRGHCHPYSAPAPTQYGVRPSGQVGIVSLLHCVFTANADAAAAAAAAAAIRRTFHGRASVVVVRPRRRADTNEFLAEVETHATRRDATGMAAPPINRVLRFLQDGCLKDYTVRQVLGKGSYGSVYLVCEATSPEQCDKVAKVLRIRGREAGEWEQATAEFVAAKFAESIGVGPKIYGSRVCIDPNGPRNEVLFIILMDKFDTDLEKVRLEQNDDRVVDKVDVRAALARLEGAIMRLHDGGFSHNDVKPANVAVSFEPNSRRVRSVRLIDFGMSQPLGVFAPFLEDAKGEVSRATRRVALYYATKPSDVTQAYVKALLYHGLITDEALPRDLPKVWALGAILKKDGALDDNVGLTAIRILLGVPPDEDIGSENFR